ncbi:Ser-Thr-rich glycosyl-phosphatidyl-inositol-anchored membrane family-domain-containing protein, partial [Amylostereum chailletii]
LAVSTLAFSVTAPSSGQGWTLGQSNSVTWERVTTDRLNFTILLINQNATPQFQQVLDALVDTSGSTSGTTAITLPSTVSAGDNYQVNFVQDSQSLNTILAQSGKFSIAKATASATSATSATAAKGSSSSS